MKYIVYATADNGEGYATVIGIYDDPEEIEIRCGMFAPDVVITVDQKEEEEKKDCACEKS